MKNKVDAFIKFGELANSYGDQYSEMDFSKEYPADKFRLDIACALLEQIQPKLSLDVGCGTGDPLVHMLKKGLSIEGFDYSKEMLEKAKSNLERAGFSRDIVHCNDMENIKGIKPDYYDCVVALGSLYYARNFKRTMGGLVSLLPHGGNIIFSLRNDLFSLFSMNDYTHKFFLNNFIDYDALSEKNKTVLSQHMSNRLIGEKVKKSFETIDDLNVHSIFHNPLTVEDEVLSPNGLKLKGIYFYHYHALPPIFEHIEPLEFRRLSAAMENPTDWRGLFMSSAFVVHAEKQ